MVEHTLDEKVSALLATTAAIAANDAAEKARSRARVIMGVVLTLVLAGLASIQVQLVLTERENAKERVTRCEVRNRQSKALLDAIHRGQSQPRPDLSAEQLAQQRANTDRFLLEFGPLPDCDKA